MSDIGYLALARADGCNVQDVNLNRTGDVTAYSAQPSMTLLMERSKKESVAQPEQARLRDSDLGHY